LPLPAAGLTARWRASNDLQFGGSGCGVGTTASVRLRAGAFDIRPHGPAVDSPLTDDLLSETVARITAVEVDRDRAVPAVAYTATGTDSCADPVFTTIGDWGTDAVTATVDFKTHERLYVPFDCVHERYKPSAFTVASGDGGLYLTGLR
jgi:hypothetical protein